MRRVRTAVFTLLLTLPLLVLSGCSQPVESTARDGIAAASAFLNNENAIHTAECQANATLPVCVGLSRASHSLNLAIDALEVYCSGSGFNAGTAPCQVPKGQQDALGQKLASALNGLNRDIGEVKKIVAPNQAQMTGAAVLSLISLLLPLLSQLLAKFKTGGAPEGAVNSLQKAIDALQEVHDTPLMKEQLESFRVHVPWESPEATSGIAGNTSSRT